MYPFHFFGSVKVIFLLIFFIDYLVGVSPVLMFRAIAGIAERLAATGILAGVRLFSGMRSQVRFQVLQSRVGFEAAFKLEPDIGTLGSMYWKVNCLFVISNTYRTLVRLFSGVSSHMHDQHVLSFKWLFFPRAFFPTADEAFLICVDMIVIDMFHQIIL